jgi:hypothetical protein
MSRTSPARLSYDVLVSGGLAGAGDERMPDGAPLAWLPLSSTLIFGAYDALLADPPFTPRRSRPSATGSSGPAGGWRPLEVPQSALG